jgi:hypothetical protein
MFKKYSEYSKRHIKLKNLRRISRIKIKFLGNLFFNIKLGKLSKFEVFIRT